MPLKLPPVYLYIDFCMNNTRGVLYCVLALEREKGQLSSPFPFSTHKSSLMADHSRSPSSSAQPSKDLFRAVFCPPVSLAGSLPLSLPRLRPHFFAVSFPPVFIVPPSHVCTVGVLAKQGVSRTMCQRQHATVCLP